MKSAFSNSFVAHNIATGVIEGATMALIISSAVSQLVTDSSQAGLVIIIVVAIGALLMSVGFFLSEKAEVANEHHAHDESVEYYSSLGFDEITAQKIAEDAEQETEDFVNKIDEADFQKKHQHILRESLALLVGYVAGGTISSIPYFVNALTGKAHIYTFCAAVILIAVHAAIKSKFTTYSAKFEVFSSLGIALTASGCVFFVAMLFR